MLATTDGRDGTTGRLIAAKKHNVYAIKQKIEAYWR